VRADCAYEAFAGQLNRVDKIRSARRTRRVDHDPAFCGDRKIRERGLREISSNARIVAELSNALRVGHAQAPQFQSGCSDLNHVTHEPLLWL